MMEEPARLRERPHWGHFPIPFVTHVEVGGRPDFRVHDDERRFECALHRLCQLCGKPLILEPTVFVGQHPQRLTFGEPPMHESCFEFAWKVCPWLAGAGWSDRWRTEARDLEILPSPPDTAEVIVLWVNGASSWRCQSDPEREGGWIWVVEPTSYCGPAASPAVVWAECRRRDVGSSV
jgi:hypothetical protein